VGTEMNFQDSKAVGFIFFQSTETMTEPVFLII